MKQHKEIILDDVINKSLSKENVRLIKKSLKAISFQRFSFAKLIEERKKRQQFHKEFDDFINKKVKDYLEEKDFLKLLIDKKDDQNI